MAARSPDRDPRLAPLRALGEGRIAAPLALFQLLLGYRDGPALRRVLAAEPTPAAGRLLALLDAHAAAADAILAMLAEEAATPAADPIARQRRLFDAWVARAPEASVAFYALGDPALLAAATAEVVGFLVGRRLVGPACRVLEVGCGIGRFATALAPLVAAYHGTDIAPGMIAEAARRTAGLGNVTLAVTDGRDLAGIAAASLDLVLYADSFPYIVEAGLAAAHIREAGRVLKAAGHLLILNLSYRGDPAGHAADLAAWAEPAGLAVRHAGERPFQAWDAAVFLLDRGPPSGREPSPVDKPL